MIRVGIIHIGSSKIRLMLAEVEDVGYFKIIDELKTPFKVCYELSKKCILCNEKLNYILSTLRTYKSLCEASGAKEIFTITTSFFNDLKDSESIIEVLKKKKKNEKIPFNEEVISNVTPFGIEVAKHDPEYGKCRTCKHYQNLMTCENCSDRSRYCFAWKDYYENNKEKFEQK